MKKFLISLLMIPAVAQAEFYTGNELYQRLTNDGSTVDRMVAMGYVMGVYDVGVHALFCPGRETGITAGQINDMVRNWLAVNANRRHESAERLVMNVFKQTWPCANRGAKGV